MELGGGSDGDYNCAQWKQAISGKVFLKYLRRRRRETQTEKFIDSLIITTCLIESVDVITLQK